MGRQRLPKTILDLLLEPSNVVHVSAVTVLEIAIKHVLQRRSAPPFSASRAIEAFREAGYLLIDITSNHAARVEMLPDLHGDPFDRLLVAQALAEPLRLVTHDSKVAAYSDSIIQF